MYYDDTPKPTPVVASAPSQQVCVLWERDGCFRLCEVAHVIHGGLRDRVFLVKDVV